MTLIKGDDSRLSPLQASHLERVIFIYRILTYIIYWTGGGDANTNCGQFQCETIDGVSFCKCVSFCDRIHLARKKHLSFFLNLLPCGQTFTLTEGFVIVLRPGTITDPSQFIVRLCALNILNATSYANSIVRPASLHPFHSQSSPAGATHDPLPPPRAHRETSAPHNVQCSKPPQSLEISHSKTDLNVLYSHILSEYRISA